MFYEKDNKVYVRHEVSQIDVIVAIPAAVRQAVYEYVYYIVIAKSIARSNMYESEKQDVIRQQMGDKRYSEALNYKDLGEVIEMCKKCIYSEEQFTLESYKDCLARFRLSLRDIDGDMDISKTVSNITQMQKLVKQLSMEIQSAMEDGTYLPVSPYLIEDREFVKSCFEN